MKFNYTKASKIWDEFFDLCGDPWTTGDEEKQQERRLFLRVLTRKIKSEIETYIDFIKDEKHYVCEPYPNDKSKVWDFDLMRQYDSLIAKIENFEN